MKKTYNGWANYETWRINLEVLDGMTHQDFGVCITGDAEYRAEEIRDLAYRLDDYVAEVVGMEAKGFALDLALSFLSEVDWEEIAEHMVDDTLAEMN